MVEIKHSDIHGYGLFATEDISSGSIILQSPCINIYGHTVNYKYAFVKDQKNIMLPLDRASLINGSDTPNVKYYFVDNILVIECIKDIKEGDEILLRYFI